MKSQPLRVLGDGSIVRDYLFVGDLARLCVIAGLSEETGVFNAGCGAGHSILDIIKFISTLVDKEAEMIYEFTRPFDVNKVILDVSLAKTVFGWSAETTLEDGIEWQWLKEARENTGKSQNP